MLEHGNLSIHQLLALKQINAILSRVDPATLTTVVSFERSEHSGVHQSHMFTSFIHIVGVTQLTSWLNDLGDDAQCVLDFVLGWEALTKIAKRHGINYRTARRRFCSALNKWQTG